MNLEKELINWHKEHFKKDGTFIGMSGFYLTNRSQMDIARHFFELGMSVNWNEYDETELTNTIIMIKEGASLHFSKKDITKAVNWLKSLKPKSATLAANEKKPKSNHKAR